MRSFYVLLFLLLLVTLLVVWVPKARGDDTNLGLIPNAWTTSSFGQSFASNVFVDYNVTYNGQPSIRIDPHTSSDTNTARECDNSKWLPVNPGDHIVFTCWIKVQTGPLTNDYPDAGGRIGVDFYSNQHYLDGISWAGQYTDHVPSSVNLNWVSDVNGGVWQQRTLDFIVPGTVHDYTAGGSGTPSGIIVWMQASPEAADDPTASSVWFAGAELYINPVTPLPSASPMSAPSPSGQPLFPVFGNAVKGNNLDAIDADSQSVSYFTSPKTELVTDIMVFCSGISAGNARAALYAVSSGSAGALLEQSWPASVGTAFSWVDFQLPSAYPVTSGTTYGIAIMGNVPMNLAYVVGTGQRDHNAVSSYAQGFANPFGGTWGTNSQEVSIYAATTLAPTPTPTPTNTPTPSPSPTNSPIPTSSPTFFPTPTPTSTSTPVHTQTPGHTPTPSPTKTPTPTSTLSPSSNPTSSSLAATVSGGTTILAGQTWALSVKVQGGSMPYAYQWFEGSTPLAGQTSAELKVTKEAAGIYSYYCQAVDSHGVIATSNTETLTVISLQQSPSPTPSVPLQSSYSTTPKTSPTPITSHEPLAAENSSIGLYAIVTVAVTLPIAFTAIWLKKRSTEKIRQRKTLS